MKYVYNILKKGAIFYFILFIVLSQSVSIIALNIENSDFYPGCIYQDGEIICTSTGERSSGFYVFAGGSACCGCTIRHYGTLPDEFPSVNVNIVTFYVTTSRSNSYYTSIVNGPNDLKLILDNYESVATSVELSSINNDPVEHSWILQFEFDPTVPIGSGTTWELLDGDDNIYSAIWLHASDLDQEGLPGIYENKDCQYAETRNLWYSVKFETDGENDEDDEDPEESTEITDCFEIKEPGYYILKNDILNSAGMTYKDILSVCILINSSDVVFDGNGYTIDGIDEMNSIGIQISGQSYQKNVTVKNVILKDWDDGLGLGVDESFIENNSFIDNDDGLSLRSGSSNNTISNNLISYNNNGLYLFGSNSRDNIIKDNKIILNNIYGIYITGSNTNLIYNNLFNNFNNTFSEGAINNWHIDKTKTENIINGEYQAGNAWYNPSGYGFSQTCIDEDNDRICDKIYEIDSSNKDFYPLASPRPSISIKNIVIDYPNSWYESPGFSRIYTFNENSVIIKVSVRNTGEVDGKAVVRLEDFPNEIGKQIRMIDVPKDQTISTSFNFNLSDYDELEGWTVYGFDTAGDYKFTVNVTDVTGNTSYDIKTDKISVKLGPKIEVYVDHEYDSDSDMNIELGEYFLLTYFVYNSGDEAVDWIELQGDYRFENFQGYDFYNMKSDGLNINDVWNFDQSDAYLLIGFNVEDMSVYTVSNVSEKFKWEPTATGVGRLNFDIEYTMNGYRYHSVSPLPATFSIYDYTGKTLTEPQVKKTRDFEVTVTGISGVNVIAKIKNTGGVYYTYKIDDKPTCLTTPCVDELLSFLPPGGSDDLTVSTEGVKTNYKFKVRYDYSSVLNTIDGLLNAVSPILPSPLDNVPLLVDIVMGAMKENIDNKKLAELGISYLLDELKNPNSVYHKAIINKVTNDYGSKIAGDLAKELTGGAIIQLPIALYKGFEWAWNNIKADADHTFYVTVVDPPLVYTVNSSMKPDSLYFGGLSHTVSNEGIGSIQLSFDKNGKGRYIGFYEIDTKDSSLSDMDFSTLSKLIIHESGQKINDYMEGEVVIEIYFTEKVSSDAYALLLADIGLSKSLISSYFENLYDYQSIMTDDHIQLKGYGVLRVSSFHDSIDNTLVIAEETIRGNYTSYGAYAIVSDEGILINASFGPYLNIPLKNTELELIIPHEVQSVTPNPDSKNGAYIWDETPSDIKISANLDSQTPGFEFLLVIISMLCIIIIIWNRKKII